MRWNLPVPALTAILLLFCGTASADDTITMEEDSYELTPVLSDLFGLDTVYNLTLSSNEGNVKARAEGDRINISSGGNWYGTCELTYRYDDGSDNHNGSMAVEVTPVNDPPEILNVDHNLEGEVLKNPFNATVKARDVDGDPLTYLWLLDGEEIPGDRNITYYIYPNERNLTLVVSDGKGGETTMSWNVEADPPPGWGEKPDNSRNRLIFWVIFGSGGLIFTGGLVWVYFSGKREDESDGSDD